MRFNCSIYLGAELSPSFSVGARPSAVGAMDIGVMKETGKIKEVSGPNERRGKWCIVGGNF